MTVESLPISDALEPDVPDELVHVVKSAIDQSTPLYPFGGATSVDFGIPAKQDGWGVDLKKLNSVIDFPARDMTITVGAGITM